MNPAVLANARILGASRRQLLTHVYFPAAASWILSSLRTSVGFAVVGAIIGEYLGASAGLGYLIAQAEGNFNSVGVFAGIIILGIFVLIIDKLLDIAESRLIKWRPNAAQAPTWAYGGSQIGDKLSADCLHRHLARQLGSKFPKFRAWVFDRRRRRRLLWPNKASALVGA